MPTTDPTPLEDALRNLGDELSATPAARKQAAVRALVRLYVPDLDGRDEVRRLRDDNARLERQNAAAMRMLRRIVVPAGHPHLVVDLANVRLALGSSSGVADLDDAKWARISSEGPGHPEETP
jgi:hypothetical protein